MKRMPRVGEMAREANAWATPGACLGVWSTPSPSGQECAPDAKVLQDKSPVSGAYRWRYAGRAAHVLQDKSTRKTPERKTQVMPMDMQTRVGDTRKLLR